MSRLPSTDGACNTCPTSPPCTCEAPRKARTRHAYTTDDMPCAITKLEGAEGLVGITDKWENLTWLYSNSRFNENSIWFIKLFLKFLESIHIVFYSQLAHTTDPRHERDSETSLTMKRISWWNVQDIIYQHALSFRNTISARKRQNWGAGHFWNNMSTSYPEYCQKLYRINHQWISLSFNTTQYTLNLHQS